mmetsp:Transcript_59066/g.110677  ORF Transcript_59066/g.110677 Transcript_59066/m.110677 type:complete len:239 (+) Transcript_59066:205-921(+)
MQCLFWNLLSFLTYFVPNPSLLPSLLLCLCRTSWPLTWPCPFCVVSLRLWRCWRCLQASLPHWPDCSPLELPCQPLLALLPRLPRLLFEFRPCSWQPLCRPSFHLSFHLFYRSCLCRPPNPRMKSLTRMMSLIAAGRTCQAFRSQASPKDLPHSSWCTSWPVELCTRMPLELHRPLELARPTAVEVARPPGAAAAENPSASADLVHPEVLTTSSTPSCFQSFLRSHLTATSPAAHPLG